MRQIVLDTETTGLKPEDGHRVIEIGCVELINRRMTGKTLHLYINPNREIDAGAAHVHGITTAFLKDKPFFADIAEQFIQFIGSDELIIHNAPFDLGFLNHELKLLKHSVSQLENLCKIIDTLKIARKLYPGQRNSLDALCKRFQVDHSHREWHGALLDSELLAKVYLAMTGGQVALFTEQDEPKANFQEKTKFVRSVLSSQPLIILNANSHELELHQEYLELLQKSAGQHYWNTIYEHTEN